MGHVGCGTQGLVGKYQLGQIERRLQLSANARQLWREKVGSFGKKKLIVVSKCQAVWGES